MNAESFWVRPSFARWAIFLYRLIPLAISLFLAYILIKWALYANQREVTLYLLQKPYQGIEAFFRNILGVDAVIDFLESFWAKFRLFQNCKNQDLLRWDMILYGLVLWWPVNGVFRKVFGHLHYWLCPYCFKATRIFEDWQCDRCHHSQGKVRYITMLCNNCRLGKMIQANCEYCHRRFWL